MNTPFLKGFFSFFLRALKDWILWLGLVAGIVPLLLDEPFHTLGEVVLAVVVVICLATASMSGLQEQKKHRTRPAVPLFEED